MIVIQNSESPGSLPDLPIREVSEVHVLVHPHFFTLNHPQDSGGHSRFGRLEPHVRKVEGLKSLDIDGRTDPRILDAFGRTELAHAYYKRKIDSLSRQPGALLVILTGENEDLDFDAESLGVEYDEYSKVLSQLKDGLPFQRRLVEYARRLGDRVEVLDKIDLSDSGTLISKLLRKLKPDLQLTVPVKVYGETLGCCPDGVLGSLRSYGFNDVELLEQRCPQ